MLRPAPAIRYGEHPDQVANLHLPEGGGPFPCVMLIHGGFWRNGWDRTLMTPLAHDLARAGGRCVERRVPAGRTGRRRLAGDAARCRRCARPSGRRSEIDTKRVVTVGHSAGGHLALWLAAGGRLDGTTPKVDPCAAVGQAAVCDLVAGSRNGLSDGAVDGLLGGSPDEVPERYAVASPAGLVFDVPVVLVHGVDDTIVPLSQSEALLEAAAGGVELVRVPGGHFEPIDPTHAAWRAVVDRLGALLGLVV